MSELSNKEAVVRLTALWAFTEAGLGGVLHLFKPPFSGLILCGLSIIYIAMIAGHSNYSAKVIVRSVLLVVFVKMLVSPHSGIMAYFAVLFQGFLGAFIFGFFKRSNFALFLFAVVAMLESALQKLIILTVLFGMSFWEAVNEFGQSVYLLFFSSAPEGYFFSWTAVSGYLMIYFAGGLTAAYMYIRIQRKLQRLETDIPLDLVEEPEVTVREKKPKKRKWTRAVVLLILLVFTVLFSSTISDWSGVFYILLRTVLVIWVWLYILNPMLFYLLRKTMKRRFEGREKEVGEIRELFPRLKTIVRSAWGSTRHMSGLKRMEGFLVLTFYYLLKK